MTRSTPSPRTMRLAIIASALLVVLGLLAFWYASDRAAKSPRPASDHQVTVTIRGKTCDPGEITVPAGRTTFTIVNATDRALEWEILDGVMVVDERENIAPGLRQTMTVKLTPGDYAITCGLLNNPRGRLHVTPSAESDAEAARPSLVAYVGPLAEYQAYLLTEAETLDAAAQALVAALRAGQLDKARALYAPAHQAYVRIESAAQLFGDLEARLNAPADYFEKKEADPAFLGFRRIQRGLSGDGDTRELGSVGDHLLTDIAALKERLATMDLMPEQLAGLAEKQLRRLSGSLQASTPYDTPADLQAAFEGTGKIADLLSPLLLRADPKLDAALKADIAAYDRALAPFRVGEGIGPAALDAAGRRSMAKVIAQLAQDFANTNAALGLT
ncbi:MAG: iron uptake system protein EfeO [Sphingobium sp.]